MRVIALALAGHLLAAREVRPQTWWGFWVLLRALDDREPGPAIAALRSGPAAGNRQNLAFAELAEAVLAGRTGDGEHAAKTVERWDTVALPWPWLRHLGRRLSARRRSPTAGANRGAGSPRPRSSSRCVQPGHRRAPLGRELLREAGPAAEVEQPRLRADVEGVEHRLVEGNLTGFGQLRPVLRRRSPQWSLHLSRSHDVLLRSAGERRSACGPRVDPGIGRTTYPEPRTT
jgi:hypothetical protein